MPDHASTSVEDRNRWSVHIRTILTLALPLIGAQLAQMAIHVTDTVMLGWLGAEELAGSVLGSQLFFLLFIIGSGFSYAVMPLASVAVGEGDQVSVRRAVRMGFWVVGIVSVLSLVPMWFSAPLFRALKQEPELVVLASSYLQIAMWGLPFALITTVLRAFLSAIDRPQVVLWATIAGAFLNAFLNWVFIFGNLGAPALGIEGAAIASVGTNILTVICLVLYVSYRKTPRSYELFVRIWKPDWSFFFKVSRLGGPISATLLAEVGLFAASSILMGWLGVIPLAAHGVALQIISVIFMIPFGFSQAATVRVGQAYGRSDALAIDRVAKTALVMSVGVAVLAAIALVVIPEPMIGLFLDEDNADAAAVVALGVPLLAVAAAFQIVDTLQVVSAGLLRGLQDTRVPMIIAVASYWGIGVPAAWVLAFPLGFGAPGVWAGLACGLFLAAIFLTARFVGRARFLPRPQARVT